VDERRELMQQILGGVQEDYRRLTRVFDKSAITNFSSHDFETKENPQYPSAANGHMPSPNYFMGRRLTLTPDSYILHLYGKQPVPMRTGGRSGLAADGSIPRNEPSKPTPG
jgi:hypothetical protein